MSVRDLSYADYGINDNELANILMKIRNDDAEQLLFLECCKQVKPEIANDIYYSFTGKVSYDDLKMIKCVPLPKPDFYGYRRKAIAIYNNIKKTK